MPPVGLTDGFFASLTHRNPGELFLLLAASTKGPVQLMEELPATLEPQKLTQIVRNLLDEKRTGALYCPDYAACLGRGLQAFFSCFAEYERERISNKNDITQEDLKELFAPLILSATTRDGRKVCYKHLIIAYTILGTNHFKLTHAHLAFRKEVKEKLFSMFVALFSDEIAIDFEAGGKASNSFPDPWHRLANHFRGREGEIHAIQFPFRGEDIARMIEELVDEYRARGLDKKNEDHNCHLKRWIQEKLSYELALQLHKWGALEEAALFIDSVKEDLANWGVINLKARAKEIHQAAQNLFEKYPNLKKCLDLEETVTWFQNEHQGPEIQLLYLIESIGKKVARGVEGFAEKPEIHMHRLSKVTYAIFGFNPANKSRGTQVSKAGRERFFSKAQPRVILSSKAIVHTGRKSFWEFEEQKEQYVLVCIDGAHSKFVSAKSEQEQILRLRRLNIKNITAPHEVHFRYKHLSAAIVPRSYDGCHFAKTYCPYNVKEGHPISMQKRFYEINHFIFSIATALESLHKNDLVHCDVKLDNVLYDLKRGGKSAKIIDLETVSESGTRRNPGTIIFSPHEMFLFEIDVKGELVAKPQKCSIDPSFDCFCLGALIVEIITGEDSLAGTEFNFLRDEKEMDALFERAKDKVLNTISEPKYRQQCTILLHTAKRLMHPKPGQRISAKDAIKSIQFNLN